MIDEVIKSFVEFLNIIVQSYIGGGFVFLYGLWSIKRQLRKKDNADIVARMRGWATGIGAIILGMGIIIFKLIGN